ncbi:endoglucanase 9-like isoform X1 [Solanum dulcamara]|uniref:endoglucanase 9-like isoform X1 n=1 Tax=Solanum dulcamara TaxID=45834 RepID=UPI002486562C|nr:endoglucanase 9-like isoform X1 [Solanum dulcamara]
MSNSENFNSVQYVHTISESGRLLPSASRWNSIELDFNFLPKSSLNENFESLPTRFSKSIDFNLFVKNKIHFKRFVVVAALIILIIPSLILLKHFYPPRKHHNDSSHNITLALNKALLFFDAQKSGQFVENSLIRFRGNSGMNDGNSSEKNLDLVGGFYDAGNNIKFSFTIAYTVSLLSWTVIEYHEKYEDIGELDHVTDIIKWGSLYLLKLFVPPNNSSSTSARVYSQVGGNNSNAENDLTCWQRPEDMNYPRLVSVCDISTTASDLAGEMVAAMSAASLVLKEDEDISEKLVKAAEELFILANRTEKKGKYTTNDDCGGQARQFYNSTSYKDELVWGGIWLFFAKGNKTYLKYATENFASAVKEQVASDEGVFDWNNKITAISILLTRIRYFRDLGYPYESSFISSMNKIDMLMCLYTSDTKYSKTEGGLILIKPSTDASLLQYSATSSFLSKLYSDYLQLLRTPSRTCSDSVFSSKSLKEFSQSQVNYILGDNPLKMSYVVGYGNTYPVQVHHRAASIPWDGEQRTCSEGNQWLNSRKGNPNTILGAMVAGPNKDDVFSDERSKPWFTEPNIASNAGLVAALVALHDPPTGFSDPIGGNLGIDKNGMFENVKEVS